VAPTATADDADHRAAKARVRQRVKRDLHRLADGGLGQVALRDIGLDFERAHVGHGHHDLATGGLGDAFQVFFFHAADGNRAGLDITRAEAWTWLSRNPARALGIEDETGTLAAGRRADVVVWSADPLSSYAVAERVYMDGALIYERGADREPPSDFELGQTYTERAQ
jgi:cytosine/adenosine deaminase-related metal-dependent hydrolase